MQSLLNSVYLQRLPTELVRELRRWQIELSAAEAWNNTLKQRFTLFVFLICVVGIAGGPMAVGRSLPFFEQRFLSNLEHNFFPIFVAWFIGLLILALPLFIIMFASPRAARYMGTPSVANYWMAIGTVAYVVVAYRIISTHRDVDPSLYERAAAVALVSLTTYVGLALIGSVLIALVGTALSKRRNSVLPNAVIIDLLFQLLVETERESENWNNVNLRGKAIKGLEQIATCIERDLPQRLRSGNVVTDSGQSETSLQMAAGVRSLTKWIYTPKLDTRDYFLKRLTQYLTWALSGDWDSFERLQPETVSRPELLKSRAKSILVALLSAAVPIVMLTLVNQLNLVEGVVLTYLKVGAYIWASLSLLSQIDPSYGSKISALKEISNLLPLPKREKS